MGSTDFSSATVEFKDGKAHIRTCFTAGTLIHTKEGLKVIEDIKVGDLVLSWNEKTGQREYKEVTELFLHEVELLYEISFQRLNDDSLVSLVDEAKIETTWNHPFWVVGKKDWVEARELNVGDRVLLSFRKEVAISGIRSYNVEATRVYNFEVADNHTYFVGEDGVLVHNYELSRTSNKDGFALSIRRFVKPFYIFSSESTHLQGVDPVLADEVAINVYSEVYGKNKTDSDGAVRVPGQRDVIEKRMDAIIYDIVGPTLSHEQNNGDLIPVYKDNTGNFKTLPISERKKINDVVKKIIMNKNVQEKNRTNFFKNRDPIDDTFKKGTADPSKQDPKRPAEQS